MQRDPAKGSDWRRSFGLLTVMAKPQRELRLGLLTVMAKPQLTLRQELPRHLGVKPGEQMEVFTRQGVAAELIRSD